MNSLDPKSREVLRAGQADEGPTAADRERLRQKLAVALATGAAGPELPEPPAAVAKGLGLRAVVGGVGVVSAVVIGVAAVVATRPPVHPPVVQARPVAVAAAPEVEPEVEPAEVSPQEAPTEPPSAPGPAPRVVKKAVKKVVRPPEPAAPPVTPVVVAPPTGASPPVASPSPDELEAETQGLREVQLALRARQPGRALELLDQQDARFSRGQLRQEREGARVLALCATDAKAGGEALERFRAAHPTSPLLARLKGACGR
ncbi:MAG: hypothetical protein MUC96_37110 [Myxococcaceae bacterium]|jgi:hypothetical protein|nr:hypothetical protein [Myxococcaceae bacterium]